MTLTLSPETEADIRELLRLWGWDAKDRVDPVHMEGAALGALRKGVADMIALQREIAALRARLMPTVQVVPDARVFDETPSCCRREGNP